MRIDIWSDVICPWCYLGSRRLSAAIDRFIADAPDRSVTVRWRAFELDPGAPSDPQPMRPVIERKYGPGAFDSMTARLVSLGVPAGIDYRFEQTQRVNTFDAHRLLSWAGSPGAGVAEDTAEAQSRLAERLFAAYFTEGRNIADRTVLTTLSGEVGLDADEAGEVLASSAFAPEVRADEAAARERDITGVPAVVINDRLLVPGAQEVDTFLRVLEKAAATS